MDRVKAGLQVVRGGQIGMRKTPLEAAYEHFRLDRMGNRVSPNTLIHYDAMVRPFLAWATDVGIRAFEDLGVESVRHYRALVATRETRGGVPLQDRSVLDSHKALLTFFRWAADEDCRVEAGLLNLRRPKVAEKEATVFHIRELRALLDACNAEYPVEDLVVRLVGSGVRASELCGLAQVAPDGLPDLMVDSLQRGRVELRVRWNAGAKKVGSRVEYPSRPS